MFSKSPVSVFELSGKSTVTKNKIKQNIKKVLSKECKCVSLEEH